MVDLLGGIVGGLASLAGGFLNSNASQANNAANIAYQTEFAQNGIQWRVADARKAGINPLAALGAQTSSFSNQTFDPSLGNGVAASGQDISRALSATRSPEDRALAAAKSQLDVQSLQLDNDLKRAQLASALQRNSGAGVGPPMPTPTQRFMIDGQGATAITSHPMSPNDPNAFTAKGGLIQTDPLHRTAVSPENPGSEIAAVPQSSWQRTLDGGMFPSLSKDANERMSNDSAGTWMYNVYNRWLPYLGVNQNEPPFPLPEGHKWVWDPRKGAYYPMHRWPSAKYGPTWIND